MRRKSGIRKKIAKGMIDMAEMFRDRNMLNGLSSEEFISLFYRKDLPVVLRYDDNKKKHFWKEIKLIKKYLVKTHQMAIIHKSLPKGTELYNEEFGKRTLEKTTNIFFRCQDIGSALGYKAQLDKIINGCELIGENVMEIIESEERKNKIMDVIKGEEKVGVRS